MEEKGHFSVGNLNLNFTEFIWSKVKPCAPLVMNVKVVSAYILGFLAVLFLSNIARALLKSYQQPRMVAETLVGVVAGNIINRHEKERTRIINTFDDITEFGMIFYMLALGLEMDPRVLFQLPTPAAIVAYSGMLSTFILGCLVTQFFAYAYIPSLGFTFSLSVTIAGTASPVLTRLITDLKIGKSEVGRLLVAAGMHCDLVSTLLVALGLVVLSAEDNLSPRGYKEILKITFSLITQVAVAAAVSPTLMNWINYENPAGKRMKGSHMVISVAFVAICCGYSVVQARYSPVMSAFISGIALPREGRLSKMMIGKINYFLKSIFYPIFFVWVGLGIDLQMLFLFRLNTWSQMVSIFLVVALGKVAGTFLAGRTLGFNLPESVAVGLLLSVKGHFHMFLALSNFHRGDDKEMLTSSTRTGFALAILITVIFAPAVGSYIMERGTKRTPSQRMTLQWLDPETELRILLCLHGPHHLPSTINFIEMSRGTDVPGIMVHVTDTVELTPEIESTLVHKEGEDVVTVTDRAVVQMRKEITAAIRGYEEEHESGVTLRRMLVLSPFNVMHEDICTFAAELQVSLIILPFHRYPAADGRMAGDNSRFRSVNKKVLQNAPCSVGILVDRGFGVTVKVSRTSISLNAAVIFIGGKDDREALAYAGHIARHPGVKLTVLRFLLDTSNPNSRSTRPSPAAIKVSAAEQEKEMKVDDEFFAGFYEEHVRGQVAYTEKYLANSGETMSALQSLEGKYGLIIVGRGERANSALTAGMNDWQQCPELGPVGDILSGPTFEIAASILIIQQHNPPKS